MDRKIVKKFLACDYPELIDLALNYARLTDKQQEIVDLCFKRGLTQEDAAEKTGYDVSTIRRWYNKAMKSMCAKFDHLPWIYKVL